MLQMDLLIFEKKDLSATVILKFYTAWSMSLKLIGVKCDDS